MTEDTTINIKLWTIGIGQTVWRCQCGAQHWCSEQRSGRGYLTAGQVAKKTAEDHAENAHTVHATDQHPAYVPAIRWNLKPEDTKPEATP